MGETITTPTTVKPRRWLNYALQLLWLVVAFYVVQLYIFSIRPGYTALLQVCSEPVCPVGQLTLEGVASLNALGISIPAFTIYQQFLIVAVAAIYAVVSLMIFQAKRHDNTALFVALVLLTYGAFVSNYYAQVGVNTGA